MEESKEPSRKLILEDQLSDTSQLHDKIFSATRLATLLKILKGELKNIFPIGFLCSLKFKNIIVYDMNVITLVE